MTKEETINKINEVKQMKLPHMTYAKVKQYHYGNILGFEETEENIPKEIKRKKVTECILILDKLKFLILTAWEAKLILNKQYEEMSIKLTEIGKMFGGWRTNIEKSNTKTPPRN